MKDKENGPGHVKKPQRDLREEDTEWDMDNINGNRPTCNTTF